MTPAPQLARRASGQANALQGSCNLREDGRIQNVRDLAAVRQLRLVEHLDAVGHGKVEDLARSLGVTPQTIRGDLRQLDEQGVVSRVRGGAMLRSRLDNLGYHSRQALAADA